MRPVPASGRQRLNTPGDVFILSASLPSRSQLGHDVLDARVLFKAIRAQVLAVPSGRDACIQRVAAACMHLMVLAIPVLLEAAMRHLRHERLQLA